MANPPLFVGQVVVLGQVVGGKSEGKKGKKSPPEAKERVAWMGRLPCYGATWVGEYPKLPKPSKEAIFAQPDSAHTGHAVRNLN